MATLLSRSTCGALLDIWTHLLNLHETYKTENKAVEHNWASCVMCDVVFEILCTEHDQ